MSEGMPQRTGVRNRKTEWGEIQITLSYRVPECAQRVPFLPPAVAPTAEGTHGPIPRGTLPLGQYGPAPLPRQPIVPVGLG